MWIRGARRQAPRAHGDRHPAPGTVGRAPRRGCDLLGSEVKVTVWGTRGSQPTPGPETVRYGGNTSCVELTLWPTRGSCSMREPDCAASASSCRREVARVDVLLSHLHMDHIQGLGFFAPLFRPGFEVHIWGPGSATADLRTRLTRYMSPPLFPVRLPELPCDLHLHDLGEEPVEVPGLTVRAALVCHPGPTVGYRVHGDQGSLAYLPDHEPMLACPDFADSPEWCSGLEIAAGADVLAPRRAVHRRRVRAARRLGSQHTRPRPGLRPARGGRDVHAVPPRSRTRRRHARRDVPAAEKGSSPHARARPSRSGRHERMPALEDTTTGHRGDRGDAGARRGEHRIGGETRRGCGVADLPGPGVRPARRRRLAGGVAARRPGRRHRRDSGGRTAGCRSRCRSISARSSS